MRAKRVGISLSVAAVAVAVVIVVAALGYIFLSSPKSQGASSSSLSGSASALASTTASSMLTSGPGRLLDTFAAGTPVYTSEMTLNYTLTLRSLGGTPTTPMTLTLDEPAGLNLTVVPAQVTVTASEPAAVSVTGQPYKSLAAGSYRVAVTATAGGSYYNETLDVQVMNYLVVTIGTTFVPQNLTVPVGTTVTWLRLNGPLSQYDNGTHNVDFGSAGIPKSPNLAQWGTWSYTFTQPGTYPYLCDFHPWQTGTIIVTPAG